MTGKSSECLLTVYEGTPIKNIQVYVLQHTEYTFCLFEFIQSTINILLVSVYHFSVRYIFMIITTFLIKVKRAVYFINLFYSVNSC